MGLNNLCDTLCGEPNCCCRFIVSAKGHPMKMPRKIPHVYIWSRHTPGCRGKRGKKPADYTRCNCPKQLVWYQWDGAKQRSVEHREAAECFDFETAEERARAKT